MFFTIVLSFMVALTILFMYLFEYRVYNYFLYWSIPLYLLASLIIAVIVFFTFTYIWCLKVKKGEYVEKPTKFTTVTIRAIAKFIVSFYRIKVDLKVECDLPKDGKFLLVSNHQSMLDPIITIAKLDKYDLVYIMKDGIMRLPFIGKVLYKGGFLPLDRQNNRKGLETILNAIGRLKRGNSVCVFPEGTRSKDTYVREFKPGIFKVVQKAKCDIFIVTHDNNFEIKNRWPFRSTKVLLKCSRLIKYDEIKDLQTNEISDMVRNIIIDDLEANRKSGE